MSEDAAEIEGLPALAACRPPPPPPNTTHAHTPHLTPQVRNIGQHGYKSEIKALCECLCGGWCSVACGVVRCATRCIALQCQTTRHCTAAAAACRLDVFSDELYLRLRRGAAGNMLRYAPGGLALCRVCSCCPSRCLATAHHVQLAPPLLPASLPACPASCCHRSLARLHRCLATPCTSPPVACCSVPQVPQQLSISVLGSAATRASACAAVTSCRPRLVFRRGWMTAWWVTWGKVGRGAWPASSSRFVVCE